MDKKLLKHIADGGAVIDEDGSQFTANSNNKAFLRDLINSNWRIVPEYTDGIYMAKRLRSGGEVTLMKGDEWEEIDLGGSFSVDINDYTSVTRIGDLPKEPTIADKIAAVPNDFVPDWRDHNQFKWAIRYDHFKKKWVALFYSDLETPNTTYFRTKEEVQRVIDEVLS